MMLSISIWLGVFWRAKAEKLSKIKQPLTLLATTQSKATLLHSTTPAANSQNIINHCFFCLFIFHTRHKRAHNTIRPCGRSMMSQVLWSLWIITVWTVNDVSSVMISMDYHRVDGQWCLKCYDLSGLSHSSVTLIYVTRIIIILLKKLTYCDLFT